MPLKHGLAVLLALCLLGAAGCTLGSAGRRGKPAVNSERHLQAIIDIGLVAIRTGDYARALQSLQEAERLAPQNADVKHHLGRTYYHIGDPQQAVDYYNQALAIDPSKTDVHNNLGIVYLDLKEYDKARAEFQICISDLTYANGSMSRLNMGLVEEASGNPEAAVPYYMQIISQPSQTPAAAPAYYRMAFLEYQKGDFQQAVDYLTAAVRQNPEYADAYFLLGESYEKLKREDDAAEAFGRCVVIDPNSIRGVEAQRRVRDIMKDYN
ncbi:MAG: tetratricopeptide repeat protein [Deltaproteobacteria bacterium]|jgi:Tfp pilus assembly protein PilF|nr:tetratricopeptide repeat protein [Deltaproteobacteria bacterium]